MKKILISVYIVAALIAIGGLAYATYDPPITEGVIYYEGERMRSERYIRANGDWKHVTYYLNEDGSVLSTNTLYSIGDEGLYQYFSDGTGRLIGLSGVPAAYKEMPDGVAAVNETVLGYDVVRYEPREGESLAWNSEFRAFFDLGVMKAVRVVETPVTDALFGDRPRNAKIDYQFARNDLKRAEDRGVTEYNNEGIKKLKSLIPAEEFDKPLIPNSCEAKKK